MKRGEKSPRFNIVSR